MSIDFSVGFFVLGKYLGVGLHIVNALKKQKTLFFRAVLDKIEWKVQRVPVYPLPSHMCSLPQYQHHSLEWVHLLQLMNLH